MTPVIVIDTAEFSRNEDEQILYSTVFSDRFLYFSHQFFSRPGSPLRQENISPDHSKARRPTERRSPISKSWLDCFL
jgi:hypothetical protein